MKLYLYGRLMAACDLACAVIHRIERPFQRLREWAWVKCTHENLRTCNTRALSR